MKGSAKEKAEHKIIVVGDPKQSIFAFQGADVNVYKSAVQEISESGGDARCLKTNFRSSTAMINACNRSYYEKDYGELLDSLILWELYQDEFDKYWEVCGAYQELTLCQQYSLLEDGAEELLYHRSRLMDISVNCRNEDNVNRIKQMYEESLRLPVPGA